MTFKLRLSLGFMTLFLLAEISAFLIIYALYSDYRKKEFSQRLKSKALIIADFLGTVKENDRQLLGLIDQNSINQIYREKVLLFDNENNLIYSSLDDEPLFYSKQLLNQIKQKKQLSFKQEDSEGIGFMYDNGNQIYIILASGYDAYGKVMLQRLIKTLIATLFISMLMVFSFSFFFINKALHPLKQLEKTVAKITAQNLKQRLVVPKNTKDEISRLAQQFNQMLDRLEAQFHLQKNFVNNASHELKTPLAISSSLIEETLHNAAHLSKEKLIKTLKNTQKEQYKMAQLVHDLLLLSRLIDQNRILKKDPIRIDQLLFESLETVLQQHKAVYIEAHISKKIQNPAQLEVCANKSLLKIALTNVLINAALYSNDAKAGVKLDIDQQNSLIQISNKGEKPLTSLIFEPFYRETNKIHRKGNGLGLSIVKQIIEIHKGSINYTYQANQHVFSLKIPIIKNSIF